MGLPDQVAAALRQRPGGGKLSPGRERALEARRPALTAVGALVCGHVCVLPGPDGGLAVRGRAAAGDAETAAGGAPVPDADPAGQISALLPGVVGARVVPDGGRQARLRDAL